MTYKIQIDDEVRDATPDEAARIDEIRQGKTLVEHVAEVEAAKASARTKLAALGLTDDEINALLGA